MTGNRRLWLFVLIAYGWSWLFWIPVALIANGLSVPAGLENFLNGPFNPAAWGPLIAAFFVTFLEEGRSGAGRLLKRGLDFRLGKAWYLVVLLTFPLLIGGSLYLAVLMGDPAPELTALAAPVTLPIAFLYILFLGGPLQEEFGWRGYALEHIQKKWNAVVSSLVVGLMWGAWHIPLFFMPRQEFYYQRPMWGLMLSATLVSFLFTWLYNNTRGSVFASMLFHTVFNFSHFLFPTLGSDRASLILFGLLFAVIAVILVFFGPKRMVREGKSP